MISSYTVTPESITVISDGRPVVVRRGAANFAVLRKALLEERLVEAADHLNPASSLERWTQGKFRLVDGRLHYGDSPVPSDIAGRINEMAARGEDPTPLLKFWERLQANPSYRSVSQLWRFLNNIGIPLTSDGTFLAYKGVTRDLKDKRTGTIDNSPGQVVRMPRNQISDDPNTPCHEGLHVGALSYAETFAGTDGKVVICEVDPEHVVCVPHDYSSQKMRVCEYAVVGRHGEGEMPSTSIPDEDVPRPAPAVAGKRAKRWRRLDALDASELMKLSTEELREYAGKGLAIVGASKIRGGKWALVQTILRNRG